jgi:hypothetical protein
MASSNSAIPALSSAPKTVSPAEQSTPSRKTGSIDWPGLTVSACRPKRTGLVRREFLPGTRAIRLPKVSRSQDAANWTVSFSVR